MYSILLDGDYSICWMETMYSMWDVTFLGFLFFSTGRLGGAPGLVKKHVIWMPRYRTKKPWSVTTRRDGRFLRSKEGLPPFLSSILLLAKSQIAAPFTASSNSPQSEQSDLVRQNDQIKTMKSICHYAKPPFKLQQHGLRDFSVKELVIIKFLNKKQHKNCRR